MAYVHHLRGVRQRKLGQGKGWCQLSSGVSPSTRPMSKEVFVRYHSGNSTVHASCERAAAVRNTIGLLFVLILVLLIFLACYFLGKNKLNLHKQLLEEQLPASHSPAAEHLGKTILMNKMVVHHSCLIPAGSVQRVSPAAGVALLSLSLLCQHFKNFLRGFWAASAAPNFL